MKKEGRSDKVGQLQMKKQHVDNYHQQNRRRILPIKAGDPYLGTGDFGSPCSFPSMEKYF
jgi:hypothetical protein